MYILPAFKYITDKFFVSLSAFQNQNIISVGQTNMAQKIALILNLILVAQS